MGLAFRGEYANPEAVELEFDRLEATLRRSNDGIADTYNTNVTIENYLDSDEVEAFGIRNVKAFGARGDGLTDDTVAIQTAINDVLASTSGGVVYFPSGTYIVCSLDLSNGVVASPTHSITLLGAGRFASVLKGTCNGKILIDCLGRSYFNIQDMRLTTDGTAVYQTALLLARMTGGAPECRCNAFTRVRIDGDYSIASVVAIASEIDNWDECEFLNDDATNNYCCFFTSINNSIAGVSSDHGTVLESTNTYNVMTHCTWFAPYNNATPVIFHQNAGYTMVDCTVQVGNKTGVKCATYIDSGEGTGGGFKGPVYWITPLWEAWDCVVHHLSTTTALGYYSNIFDVGGTCMSGAGVDVDVLATNGTPAVLSHSKIADVKFIGGVGGTLSATMNHAISVVIDLWQSAFTTNITVTTAWAGSYFRAQNVSVPEETTPYPTYPITTVEPADPPHYHDARYIQTDSITSGAVPYYGNADALLDGAMEAWDSATDLTAWSETVVGASTVNKEAAVLHGGTFAARLDIDASNSTALISQSLTLDATTAYKLTIWYKTAAGKPGSFIVRDSASNVYLKSDGAWRTSASGILLTASTDWTSVTVSFVPYSGYTNYTLIVGAGTNFTTAPSSSIYLDDISIRSLSFDDSPITSDGTNVIVAGPLFAQRSVEAVTTTKTPTVAQSDEVYTNEGDADGSTITLPTAAAGLTFTVYVQAAQTVTVTAGAGDTIRIASNVTAAAGSVTSNVVGSALTLMAVNSIEWVALSSVGSWSF